MPSSGVSLKANIERVSNDLRGGMTDYQPYVTELNPVEAVELLAKLPPVGDAGVHTSAQFWPQDRQSVQLELIDNRDDYVAMAILECYPLGPLFGSLLKLEIHARDSLPSAMAWFGAAMRALPRVSPQEERDLKDIPNAEDRRLVSYIREGKSRAEISDILGDGWDKQAISDRAYKLRDELGREAVPYIKR